MFDSKDRQRSEATLDKAIHIGEKIGLILHNNGKGLIKGAIFFICLAVVGIIYLLGALAKKTVLGDKK